MKTRGKKILNKLGKLLDYCFSVYDKKLSNFELRTIFDLNISACNERTLELRQLITFKTYLGSILKLFTSKWMLVIIWRIIEKLKKFLRYLDSSHKEIGISPDKEDRVKRFVAFTDSAPLRSTLELRLYTRSHSCMQLSFSRSSLALMHNSLTKTFYRSPDTYLRELEKRLYSITQTTFNERKK